MIGYVFAKYAKENGMKVAHGAAYGCFRGYAAAFTDGSNYKLVCISTVFEDESQAFELKRKLADRNIQKQYRLAACSVEENLIALRFTDTIGTMKCIKAFFDWFIPELAASSASTCDICPDCGMPITGEGEWLLVDGHFSYHMHPTCSAKLQESVQSDEQRAREEDKGSYLSGIVGAALGGLVGSAVWAVVLYLGYVAALVGLLIGWLENFGYKLLHGKNGRGKLAILIVIAILCVIIGTFGAEAITVVSMINSGELPGFTYGDALPLILAVMLNDSGYLTSVAGNIGLGLLFAFLGMFGVLRQAKQSTSGTKFVKLP